MKVGGVDFIVYNVSDYKKALVFYRDILGLKLSEEYGGYWAEFDAGSVTLVICAPPHGVVPEPNYKGGATVALAVEDVKSAVHELKAKGVNIASKVRETDVCFKATITDPFGNRIIIHQRKDGTAG